MKKLSGLGVGLLVLLLAGCGPSDATINSSVNRKLAADNTVKSASIEATTQKRVVTLTGTVDSQETKERAVTLARQADGVSDVVNNISVAQAGEGPGGPGRGPGMMNSPEGHPGPEGHPAPEGHPGPKGKHE